MPVDPNFLMQRLMRGGMSKMHAAAVVGNLKRESSLDPNAYNSDEGAYGMMQWRGPRFQALQNFANQQGKPWNDPGAQTDFIGHELSTTERGNAQDFYAAQDIDAATKAFGNQVVRFGDKSLPERQQHARALYEADAGQPLEPGAISQQATGSAPGNVSRETRDRNDRYGLSGVSGVSGPYGLLNSQRRGIRGGLETLGEGLSMAFRPSRTAASAPPAAQPPAFPGGIVPMPSPRPETAPSPLTPGSDAVGSLPGAKMGALGDIASYEDGDWYA